MKAWMLALAPWMMVSHGLAQQRVAVAEFAFLDSARLGGVRLADECYIPLDRVGEVGWTYTVQGTHADIRAEDKLFRSSVRLVRGETMIPLTTAASALGLVGEWEKDVYRLFSLATSIRAREGDFEVRVTVPARPKLKAGEDARPALELAGVRLAEDCKLEMTESSSVEKTRDGIRIYLDTRHALKTETVPDDRGRLFRLEFFPPEREPGEVEPQPAAGNETIATPTFGTPSGTAGPLLLDIESDLAAVLLLPVRGKVDGPVTFRRPEPAVVEVLLPGIAIPDLGEVKSASVESVEQRQEGSVTVLSLRLSRPMGVELSATVGQVAIQLVKPRVGDGKLAGKVVVLDAGHGAHDPGARALDGSANEKTLALAVTKLTAEALLKQGATVILTRKGDTFLPLSERPAIANRNNAHFFLSIHINSSAVANKASGTITFYHRQNAIGQLLADCLHREIVKVSQLPSIGVWSDSRIYRTGFAVLRTAKMPAVLLELGFINNRRDLARMKQPAFQQAVAGAIVQGLKNYLGGQ